ncbi:MAG: S8 family serine peptidase [Deltaproteobacteria bacterium]|nr:S8 family serine peptidase [Deltaproteobacteria bacterium]
MSKSLSRRVGILMVVLGLVACGVLAPGVARAEDWRDKVHPLVTDGLIDGPVWFFAVLDERADLSGARELATKEQKGHFVFERLTEVAESTQAPLLRELQELGVAHRRFFIVNAILIHGDCDLVERIARRSDVRLVLPNPRIEVDLAGPSGEPAVTNDTRATEWGLDTLGVPEVWGLGIDGEGVVVGGQDTGVEWDHAAIMEMYRGWDGSAASHDYNWYDSIHSGGGSCGADSIEPCDDHDHGTHTIGTIVGDDGGDNQIGVAPGALWIACRNMDQGVGWPSSYLECYEFFLAPCPVGGSPLTDGDPSLAPHVTNNSWMCPPSEGCSWDVLQEATEAQVAAGIVMVASNGNEGSGCSSCSDPPAIYEASFSVGASNSDDDIAGFSSRGPVTVDSSDRMKPNVSAPGVGVRSCVPGGGYASWNGTSMAGPHVAGLVALLISAEPSLAGQVEQIEQIIEQTALPRTTNQGCGGDSSTDVPNNVYGHGIVSASAAVACLDCDDTNECTVDSCDHYGCLYDNVDAGTPCGSDETSECDNPDTCDGDAGCLPNHEPAETLCREAAGECDVDEFCTGESGDCPDDLFVEDGTPCDDLDPETVDDACLGGECLGQPLDPGDTDSTADGGQQFSPGSAGCGCDQAGRQGSDTGLLQLLAFVI